MPNANAATGSSLDAAQVAREAAGGDSSARAAFWGQHAREVHAWLWFRWRRTSLRACIDDAMQEVYLECFRPHGAFTRFAPERASHGVTAFLRGVVRNVAHRFERQRAREQAHRHDYAGTRPAAIAHDDRERPDADAAVEHDRILAALERLDRDDPARDTPHSLRTFLRLHFEDGLPVRAIARLWREPPERVHALRRRACRSFRTCLLAGMRDAAEAQPAT